MPNSRTSAEKRRRPLNLSDESTEDVQKEEPFTVFFERRAKARRQTGAGTPNAHYVAS
jgi:hypothetical protein